MKPKISYIYYCYNVIKQRGEENVRSSFESLKWQSDDIIVIDHDSEDNIKEIAEEFGFRYFNVPKTPNIYCHHSKMINKSIIEAKYNLYVQAEVDFVYPNNLSYYIISFYHKHNPRKEMLFIRCFYDYGDGTLYPTKTYQRSQGALRVLWKPFLLQGRGVDERCTFGTSSNYQLFLMKTVFGCRIVNSRNYFLIHRDHPPQQCNRTDYEIKLFDQFKSGKHLELLKNNLKKNRRLTKNSYW